MSQIDGNLRGVKPSQRKALERTFRRRVPPGQVVSAELARHLSALSKELGRQVGVLLARDGTVQRVIVGDASRLEIPEIGRLRGGTLRFRGLRLVHTHLHGEDLTRDDLNDLALLRLDLVAMVQVDATGEPGAVELAHFVPGEFEHDGNPFRRIRARRLHMLDFDFSFEIRELENELARLRRGRPGETARERVLLIGVHPDDERLVETAELARAASVDVAGTLVLRGRIHPRTVVGKGRLERIVLEGMRRGAEAAIFDIDVRPAQARAFEDATGLKAVDRTQLILDIFAQRARSRDGKLQVELAQLIYSLPRLTEKDAGLSRLRGGIGGRGPGETVLELGRRRIRDRIRQLEKQIDQLACQRKIRQQRRQANNLPTLSIVGYTNAGKSTLLNALTDSRVGAGDQMFVTLDPSSRRLRFPREGEVIITDTVGFIHDLPPNLVTAFRATLEELHQAHVLINVVDASDPRMERKMDAVEQTLTELGLNRIPRLLVMNKSDLVEPARLQSLCRRHDAVPVSALLRNGLDRLVAAAEAKMRRTASSGHPGPTARGKDSPPDGGYPIEFAGSSAHRQEG